MRDLTNSTAIATAKAKVSTDIDSKVSAKQQAQAEAKAMKALERLEAKKIADAEKELKAEADFKAKEEKRIAKENAKQEKLLAETIRKQERAAERQARREARLEKLNSRKSKAQDAITKRQAKIDLLNEKLLAIKNGTPIVNVDKENRIAERYNSIKAQKENQIERLKVLLDMKQADYKNWLAKQTVEMVKRSTKSTKVRDTKSIEAKLDRLMNAQTIAKASFEKNYMADANTDSIPATNRTAAVA